MTALVSNLIVVSLLKRQPWKLPLEKKFPADL
jgi:hypothetical protein